MIKRRQCKRGKESSQERSLREYREKEKEKVYIGAKREVKGGRYTKKGRKIEKLNGGARR